MIDLGIVKPGSTLYIPFATYGGANGESITCSGLAVTDIEIYKDGGTTQRASDSGYSLLDTDGIDFDTTTGIHGISIDLSDNTTAGFYAAGSRYWVVIASITVDSQTVNFIPVLFTIGYPDAVLNTTIATLSSQTSFTLTAGPAEDNALRDMWAIIHDVASAVQWSIVKITGYTGSTKTVTLEAGATFTAAATDNISITGPLAVLANNANHGGSASTLRLGSSDNSVIPFLVEHSGSTGIAARFEASNGGNVYSLDIGSQGAFSALSAAATNSGLVVQFDLAHAESTRVYGLYTFADCATGLVVVHMAELNSTGLAGHGIHVSATDDNGAVWEWAVGDIDNDAAMHMEATNGSTSASLSLAVANGATDAIASPFIPVDIQTILESAPAATKLKQSSLAVITGAVATAAGDANTNTIFDTDLPQENDDYYGDASGGLVLAFPSGETNQFQTARIIASTSVGGNTRITLEKALDAIPADGDEFVALGRITELS